jgi:capsid protein
MPYIVAVMDATGANYSTMRGDYLVYRKHVAVERAEIERVVLDPLLERWIEEATFVDGAIPDGLPPRDQWSWRWRWDGFEHVDPLKEANAETVGIENKTVSRAEACARRGKDGPTQTSWGSTWSPSRLFRPWIWKTRSKPNEQATAHHWRSPSDRPAADG